MHAFNFPDRAKILLLQSYLLPSLAPASWRCRNNAVKRSPYKLTLRRSCCKAYVVHPAEYLAFLLVPLIVGIGSISNLLGWEGLINWQGWTVFCELCKHQLQCLFVPHLGVIVSDFCDLGLSTTVTATPIWTFKLWLELWHGESQRGHNKRESTEVGVIKIRCSSSKTAHTKPATCKSSNL